MLPTKERILLGPGPSLTSPRVMRALAAPTLSHLDPQFLEIMDDVRARLGRLFQAPVGSFAFAVSGTGTSAMETAVANTVAPGTKVVCAISGYFADRLAQMATRYGGQVTRVEAEWGRAIDPEQVRKAVKETGPNVVTVVHAETSTGVLNPVKDVAAISKEHGALTIVDAVTSLGGMPLDVDGWGLDVVYSCSQKCLGAPSGMSPIVFTPRALEKRVACRSFYLDVALLEDYWVRRKYHHTMSASLIYALREALLDVEDEGLTARWARHERHHLAFVKALDRLGLSMLPAAGERLWTLNAVKVPAGVDDAAVRKELLQQFNIEIGAGLGPLAGKVFRVGLMGTSSSQELVDLLAGSLEKALNSVAQRLH
ncbi:MAG TPA: alanine--glyoxylate aminotransferase family protein [Vicinamibacterales bacterium]|nr:alanine--glyoxylate aminotransferase family protein [Vicinamibacterales bacterium]